MLCVMSPNRLMVSVAKSPHKTGSGFPVIIVSCDLYIQCRSGPYPWTDGITFLAAVNQTRLYVLLLHGLVRSVDAST